MSLSDEEIQAARALVEAATPGPWEWFGNTDARSVQLATTHSGRRFVMTFHRWGMQNATPAFQSDGLMRDAERFARWEVCPEATDKTDERLYRRDFRGLRHPDAEFIATARTLVPRLLDALEQARAEVVKVEEARRYWQQGFYARDQRAEAAVVKARKAALHEAADWFDREHDGDEMFGSTVSEKLRELADPASNDEKAFLRGFLDGFSTARAAAQSADGPSDDDTGPTVFYQVQERLGGQFWRDLAGPFSTPGAASDFVIRTQNARIGKGPWRVLRCEDVGGAGDPALDTAGPTHEYVPQTDNPESTVRRPSMDGAS